METRKLYYEDSMLWEFSAQVLECTETDKGFAVVLDATAFYPEGGGQACDLGTLADANVLDVREQGKQVVHLCDRALAVGEQVTGKIEANRRFRLMQQHSGEHIISGLVHKAFGCHNVGFHMGKTSMEIDFDMPITWEQLQQIELDANRVVWADLPLKCWYPSPEELPQVAYRTKRELPWPVRIVQIPGADSCACCGVHVQRTGQIGLIKILSCVKFHQGVRLQLVCGEQALEYMQDIFEQNRIVSQTFSAKPLETGAAAIRARDALEGEKFRSAGLEKQVFASIAENYANQGDVLHFADGLTPGALRNLADAIADKIHGIAAVFSGSDENGYSYCLMSRCTDVRPLGKAVNQALSGRGGGKAEAVQGSVKCLRQQVEAFWAEK